VLRHHQQRVDKSAPVLEHIARFVINRRAGHRHRKLAASRWDGDAVTSLGTNTTVATTPAAAR
jgi:hypothetical protein